MVKKITGVILVLMLMLGVLCGCVQQADSDWAIPEDKYTGLEEFRLDESKAYSRDMATAKPLTMHWRRKPPNMLCISIRTGWTLPLWTRPAARYGSQTPPMPL